MQAYDETHLFLSISDQESKWVLVVTSKIFVGDVNVELGNKESCSFSFNFSSGSNPKDDDSSTEMVLALSIQHFSVKCFRTAGKLFS